MNLINGVEYMDKCIREKEKLYKLQLKEIGNIAESFTLIKNDTNSYFVPRLEKNYLMEYSFESFLQLKEKLDELWKNEKYMQEATKIILVAALKNKPRKVNGEEMVAENNEETELPTFIYNF